MGKIKVSIFTPSHNPKYLNDLYDSIKKQDFFEWVVLLNGKDWDRTSECILDKRVRVIRIPATGETYVGALKNFNCSQCIGDVFLEVDHDDYLAPNAVEEVQKAFEDPSIGFVYSNSANFKEEELGILTKTDRFSEAHGWVYREVETRGFKLEEHVAFPPTPQSVSKIWYAPNHLRAWRKEVYEQIGGHNKGMRVLDDQELIMRTYLVTKFKHIDKCLYFYRIDGSNTWLKYNQEIQNNTLRLYDEYIQRIAEKWSKDNGLAILDLGGRFNRKENYISVDLKDADVNTDLNEEWPFKDNSVGLIIANDILEHLSNKVHIIKEIYRVLAPGGILLSKTPSTDGRGAFQDPTHVAFYNENSFRYYTEKQFAEFIDTPVRFQEMRLYTTQPSPLKVSWVIAHLCALKGEIRPPGLININH
jgi:O-antigen biosynthesis protein